MKKLSRAAIMCMMLPAFILVASTVLGQGQTSVPHDLRGIWSFDSCPENDGEFLVVHGTSIIFLWQGDAISEAWTATAEPDENGWVQLGVDEQRSFLRRATGTPDILEMAFPVQDDSDDFVTSKPGLNPDGTYWETERATRCPALPPGPQALYGEMFAILAAIDAAEATCAAGSQRCAGELFSIGDVNANGALNTAEISRLIRVIVQLGAIEQGNGDADTQVGMVATSVPLAPILAQALISSFDYDGNNGLSLDEILKDRVVVPSSDMSQFLNGAESRVSEMMNTLETGASDLGRLLMLMR
jgi:hypothetical protein